MRKFKPNDKVVVTNKGYEKYYGMEGRIVEDILAGENSKRYMIEINGIDSYIMLLEDSLELIDKVITDTDFIKIETSLGIISIPKRVIDNEMREWKHEDFYSDWYSTLRKLYSFMFIGTKENGWIYINIDDDYYGCPEYKILD